MASWSNPVSVDLILSDDGDDDDDGGGSTTLLTCTAEQEGETRCDCGAEGLGAYQCQGGSWVYTGPCECGDMDVICMFQKLINDELGECIEYPWALAALVGIAGLVMGSVVLASR